MCKFLLLTFPAETDLATLESAIPSGLRQSQIRQGLSQSWPTPEHFGFDIVDAGFASQLPAAVNIVATMTRVQCDCWSTLATVQPTRKEVARWRSVFEFIHNVIPRFGLIVHFGSPEDNFVLRGPTPLSMSVSAPLHGLSSDTLYEVVP